MASDPDDHRPNLPDPDVFNELINIPDDELDCLSKEFKSTQNVYDNCTETDSDVYKELSNIPDDELASDPDDHRRNLPDICNELSKIPDADICNTLRNIPVDELDRLIKEFKSTQPQPQYQNIHEGYGASHIHQEQFFDPNEWDYEWEPETGSSFDLMVQNMQQPPLPTQPQYENIDWSYESSQPSRYLSNIEYAQGQGPMQVNRSSILSLKVNDPEIGVSEPLTEMKRNRLLKKARSTTPLELDQSTDVTKDRYLNGGAEMVGNRQQMLNLYHGNVECAQGQGPLPMKRDTNSEYGGGPQDGVQMEMNRFSSILSGPGSRPAPSPQVNADAQTLIYSRELIFQKKLASSIKSCKLYVPVDRGRLFFPKIVHGPPETVIAEDKEGKQWPITLSCTRAKTYQVSRGLIAFVKAHSLKEEDEISLSRDSNGKFHIGYVRHE